MRCPDGSHGSGQQGHTQTPASGPIRMPDDLGLGKELPGFLRSLWEMCCDEAGNGTIRWGKA
jgi:hypothetical protein